MYGYCPPTNSILESMAVYMCFYQHPTHSRFKAVGKIRIHERFENIKVLCYRENSRCCFHIESPALVANSGLNSTEDDDSVLFGWHNGIWGRFSNLPLDFHSWAHDIYGFNETLHLLKRC